MIPGLFRKYRSIVVVSLVAVAILIGEANSAADSFDTGIADLTAQVVASLSDAGRLSVAVVEFRDISGETSLVGKLLAEELTTSLFLTRRLDVVERTMLDRVMEEHHLAATGLIDPISAKELGKVLGVDAIASGTYATLGISTRVNARLISTETGTVFAAAATTLPPVELSKSRFGSSALQSTSSKRRLEAGEVFFSDDFQTTDHRDWGTNLRIVEAGGTHFLTSDVPGQHFAGRKVGFPENFTFEYSWTFYDDRRSGTVAPHVRVPLELRDGKGRVMRIECGNWGARLPGQQIKDFNESRGVNRFKLVKHGSRYSIYNNGHLIQSGSYPEFGLFQSFRITIPVKRMGAGQRFANFVAKAM